MAVFLRKLRGQSNAKATARGATRSRKSSRLGTGLRLENLEQRTLLHGFGFAAPPPGPATHLALWAPENVASGAAAPLEVVALDAANHVVSNYTGTVHFSSTTDATAKLPSDYTFAASDHGHHLFQATFDTTGSQSITASDTTTTSIADTISLNVTPAPAATHFGVLTPETATVGQPFSATIVALDAANHPVLNYVGTVHFSSTDGSATLPADYTFVAGDHGFHTFKVTPGTAGSQTITATDTTTSIAGSATVNADPAAVATHFGVFAKENVTAGKSFDTVVVALDAANHPVPNYTGTVHLTSTDGSATLPADYTFTTADHGFHEFHTTLTTPGSQTITANDTTTTAITGSVTVNVTPAPVATHFLVLAPENVTTGKSFDLVVIALDAANHAVTDYTGTVQLAAPGDTSAVLPTAYTFAASDHGRHVFHVTLNTTGSQTITATDTSNSSLAGTITVTANSPPATTGGGHFGHDHGLHLGGLDAFFSAFAGSGGNLFRRRH